MDRRQTLLRNKNAGRELVDYDLNIFMDEIEDRNGDWHYDPTSWKLHVYKYEAGGHQEVDQPYELAPEEIRALGLNSDEYFEGGDAWYGMQGYLQDYWEIIPDTIKAYLESFPKYKD
jgi:hypothetical protein